MTNAETPLEIQNEERLAKTKELFVTAKGNRYVLFDLDACYICMLDFIYAHEPEQRTTLGRDEKGTAILKQEIAKILEEQDPIYQEALKADLNWVNELIESKGDCLNAKAYLSDVELFISALTRSA